MASGTPVVATTIAVEGLGVEHGTHVLTSNSAEGMAKMALEVINNKDLWKKLSINGRKFVSKNYDWQLISKKLDTIYQEIGGQKRSNE